MTKLNQRVTLFLDPEIVRHAKAQAVVEDISLTQLVAKALIEYLPQETVIHKARVAKVDKRRGK